MNPRGVLSTRQALRFASMASLSTILYRIFSASRYLETRDRAAERLAVQTHRVSVLDPEVPVTTTLSTGETAPTLRRLSGEADTAVVGADSRPDKHSVGFGPVSFQTATLSARVAYLQLNMGAAKNAGPRRKCIGDGQR